ncbi:MAG TPA: hypothetical protein VFK74_07480 [Azospira sp.]|nr:hypothetical protein [Azospira sp.]
MNAAKQKPPGPQCTRCAHYYITHDVSFPYGCRSLDFKSRRPPIFEVQDASGLDCQYFQAKTRT